MPVLRLALIALYTGGLLAALVVPGGQAARAQVADPASYGGGGERPLHWSGDKTRILRQQNQVELTGNAVVNQPGESLSADYILLDLNERTLHAKGNCRYVTAETVMRGEEMRFNLDTRTGTIVAGRVSNSKFTLTGERINKLGPRRFQTHRGEYTTCRDCPNGWSIRADDVDLEFEGYARMSGVAPTIREAPLFWLPYFIVPLKTKRQTGLLFPRLGFTERGARYVLPFFWAPSRSADMTFGIGNFSGHGLRGEWEGRYRLKGRSSGEGRVFYLNDREFDESLRSAGRPGRRARFAADVSQVQELPWGIEEKLRLAWVSDNLYPSRFGDIPGANDAYLASDLIFSGGSEQVSAFVAARNFRNLLNLDSFTAFDPGTVQVYPTAVVTTNDRSLLGSTELRGGLSVGLTNFSRAAGFFDENPNDADRRLPDGTPCAAGVFCPGIDALREGVRMAVTPSLYRPLRLWDRISLVPGFEYRAFFYDFKGDVPNLARGYGLFRTDLSTRFERVFETGNSASPRLKHVIRPELTYSNIPFTTGSGGSHPFLAQIEYARQRAIPNWYFDNSDIVPLDQSNTYANFFPPLGNSLTYGFTTQLIRRDGAEDVESPGYSRLVEWRAGNTVNFREVGKEGGQPFTRVTSALLLNFGSLTSLTDYLYQPYAPVDALNRRHVFSSSLIYNFANANRPGFMNFQRSLELTYFYNKLDRNQTDNLRLAGTFSVTDYLQPSAFISYNFIENAVFEFGGNFRYQSPSGCWGVQLGATVAKCQVGNLVDYCVRNPQLNLQVNLTGDGLAGIGELTSAGAAR